MNLPLSQVCLYEGPPEGRGRSGVRSVFLTLLLCRFPSLAPLCLLLSPRASGGGKAPVSAKLTICLCAKLTGGWTSTQTLPMASWPPYGPPQSPALAPCRPPPPLPTPTLAGLAPQSMPEPLRSLSTRPWDLGNKVWRPAGELLWPPWEPRGPRDSPPRSVEGEWFPSISGAAHSSWSPLWSLPSGLLGGRKSDSRQTGCC